ncbi:MAG: biotin/lipoyl-binding protein, partial [Planctomycetia bacterium]|nr:biotin/lipoyl-binding protein [Planctomycetia bacterium]
MRAGIAASIAALAGVAACAPACRAAEGEPVVDRCLVSLMEEAKVPAREAGVLVELGVREGDVVEKGALIAKIDDSQPQMERRKARAEHEQAVAKAESDVDVRYSIAAELVAEAEHKKALESHAKVPGSVTEVERDRLKLNEQ